MSFLVYRSSAGSGKTFTLVREYLKIVLRRPEDFRHILAITFTNKAANEMKQRVVAALTGLSDASGQTGKNQADTLLQLLTADLTLSETEIASRAARALLLILHHYSEFAIGTIDSFSHRIIRSFAHDFGLPVSFDVEMDTEALLTTTVDLLLDRIGDDESLTRLLVRFVESRMEEDKGWNIDRILVSFANVLMNEAGYDQIEKLRSLTLGDFNRIAAELTRRIRKFESEVTVPAREAIRLIAEAGIPASAFYQGNRGIHRYFEALSSGDMGRLTPNNFVLATVEEEKWFSGKCSPDEKENLNRIKPKLQDLYQQIRSLAEEGQESWTLCRLVADSIYPLAVLNEIGQVMDAFKRQNNIVHISEFNNRIAGIVMKEPVPFIFERLGERYHHILMDEFQDTSRLQWLNFIPLMENALAGGYFNLVVGDGKQAIYRWRNGDVSQFAALPRIPGSGNNLLLKQRERVLEDHYKEEKLIRNYRSGGTIVDFNNRFFEWLSGSLAPSLREIYSGHDQKSDSARQEGYIHIEFVLPAPEVQTYSERMFQRVMEIIGELRSDGYMFREIAVLCRSNKDAGLLARQLILLGYPVVSSESLLLSYSPEVNFLVGFIRYLSEPHNTILQAALLGSLFHTGKLGKGNLHDLFREISGNIHPGENFYSILRDHGLAIDPDKLLSLPVYDLCEELIRHFSLDAPDPYVRFFLDSVLAFSGKGNHSAYAFIEWWEQQCDKASVVVSEGVNAIRIMTIHKAKGLQFPVVIYPFADSVVRNTNPYLWVDMPVDEDMNLPVAYLYAGKELQQTRFRDMAGEEADKSVLDLVNLLYVVMTRPEERLYILSDAPLKKDTEMRSVPAFLTGFLHFCGVWKDDDRVYAFGDPVKRELAGTEPDIPAVRISTLLSADWRKRIRIRPGTPFRWQVNEPDAKREGGTVLHEILSGIITGRELEDRIEQAVLSGKIGRDSAGNICRLLSWIINHPDLKHYFSAEVHVRTEPEILRADGAVFRPDRIVTDGKEAVVIEYKTGKKEEWHLRQVQQYAGLLSEMGYVSISKFLVYIRDNPEVVKIE